MTVLQTGKGNVKNIGCQGSFEVLLGNPAKADKVLGWERHIFFDELVERMVKNDLELVAKEIKYKAL